MAEQSLQLSFSEEDNALLNLWFPDKASEKSRPVPHRVEVMQPRGKGTAWRYTAIVEMFGRNYRVQVFVDNPGEAPYALARALESRFEDLLGQQLSEWRL